VPPRAPEIAKAQYCSQPYLSGGGEREAKAGCDHRLWVANKTGSKDLNFLIKLSFVNYLNH
jgi:hypothetical protein